jgi:hypothetical protein
MLSLKKLIGYRKLQIAAPSSLQNCESRGVEMRQAVSSIHTASGHL